MKCFDVTLNGYTASGEDDHLVKWVQADNREELVKWLELKKLTYFVRSIDLIEGGDDYGLNDGVDLFTNGDNDDLVEVWKKEAYF